MWHKLCRTFYLDALASRPVACTLLEPIDGCRAIFHKYCCFRKTGGIITNLTARNLYGHITKNIERHTAHTIVSWPNPKQWVIVHTSDLMMIIRQSIYIFSVITKEIGKLKTHSPIYCIMDNWENMLYLTHTLDKLYLTGILLLIYQNTTVRVYGAWIKIYCVILFKNI